MWFSTGISSKNRTFKWPYLKTRRTPQNGQNVHRFQVRTPICHIVPVSRAYPPPPPPSSGTFSTTLRAHSSVGARRPHKGHPSQKGVLDPPPFVWYVFHPHQGSFRCSALFFSSQMSTVEKPEALLSGGVLDQKRPFVHNSPKHLLLGSFFLPFALQGKRQK